MMYHLFEILKVKPNKSLYYAQHEPLNKETAQNFNLKNIAFRYHGTRFLLGCKLSYMSIRNLASITLDAYVTYILYL